MKEKKYLILGGKGKTGRKIAQRLTALGKIIRISSRSEQPSFDWEQPSTWLNTLVGMDVVYITFQPDLAVPSAKLALEKFTKLAVKNGIQKMVLLSGRGEKEAQLCERIVMKAGVDWTIVRADWFNQNFSESFLLDPILAGHVALPRGEVLIPFIDTDDIADVATAALLEDKHNGQVYALTGPRLLSFKQVTKEISITIGREIQFEAITIEQYNEMLKQFQLPDEYVWLINFLFTNVLDGRNSSTTNDVEKVLGRKAKDFSEYVKETAAAGTWDMVQV